MRASNWANKAFLHGSVRKAVNLVLFQAGWFTCVLLEQSVVVVVTASLLLVHHLVVVSQPREWLLVVGIAALGIGVDSIFMNAGVLNFPREGLLVPLWLCCLWLLFATTLSHGLGWLRHQLGLAAGLGAVFGPMSYLVGAQMNSASIAEPIAVSLALMAIVWALILPLALRLSRNLLEGH
ncbi:DUF2878 domain-containing protein [Proteobacteria bacterium 005FR1]|nr:DUF2878 domain-containing protein [Proteobacteria bacterium 005FR1]